jgi:hypothetical protein
MPELSSLLRQRMQAGETPGLQHPDADVLTAYVEQLLPAAERKLVLAHIAVCGDCRDVVFLAMPENALVAGPEAVVPEAALASPAPERRRWFLTPKFGLIGSIAAMAAAITLIIAIPHKNQPFVAPAATDQLSRVQPPKVAEAGANPVAGVTANPAAPSPVASSPVAQQQSKPATSVADTERADSSAQRVAAIPPAAAPASASPVIAKTAGTARKSAASAIQDVRQAPATLASAGSQAVEQLQVTAAAPLLEPSPASQNYLNGQRFAGAANDTVVLGAAQADSASAPAVSSNASAYGRQNSLLSGNWQQANNAYLVVPEGQQGASQGSLTFTPQEQEHPGLLSKIAEVGKHPLKRVQPSIQAGNVRAFAMFDKGTGIHKGEMLAANNAVDPSDHSHLANSPAFTARGFGASGRPLLSAASIYRWKVSQGKILRSADAAIWIPAYSATDGTEFSTVHASGSDIWAGGNSGQLLHSTDAGTTWEKVSLGDATAGNVISIENSGLNVRVVTAPSQIWSSLDGGKSWTKLPQ